MGGLVFRAAFLYATISMPLSVAIPSNRKEVKKVALARVSDLTGATAPDDQFGTLLVVRHPKLDKVVQLDVLPHEVAGLETEADLVILEVRLPGQDARRIIVSLDSFNSLSADIDNALARAPSPRGRQPKP